VLVVINWWEGGEGYDEMYQERQEDEVEFLQAVFPEGFQDMRKSDPWDVKRPPEIGLLLVPQVSMGASSSIRPVAIRLLVKYPTDYPDSPPHLKLDNPEGLTEDEVKELTKEIRSLARERVGEVMMLEIAQHIQAYLHSHNRPHLSLHEEMVRREREREREERRRQQEEIEASRLREKERQEQEEEELRKRMSHHSLGGSDESDSGDNLPPLLSTSAPSSHPPILPTLTLSTTPSVAPVSRLMMVDPSGNLSGQFPDGVEGGRRARLKKQIHMQRGKCLGELQKTSYLYVLIYMCM
jgi:hypothetical protein